jgi:C4-dicarboxylate transporter DctM subunit
MEGGGVVQGVLLVIIFFIAFFVFLLMGVPITFSLGASGTLSLLLSGQQLTLLVRSMFSPFESFTLLAIYLFTFMGVIFQKTGMASLLTDALMPIVGRFRGGLALVTTYGSAFFGALTGSANATCATFAKLMGPEMVKRGYPRPWTTAVIASASPLGQLIPPSLTCIVLGVATGTSIAALFTVDLAIGILTLIFMTTLILIIARKRNYGSTTEKFTRKEAIERITKALPLAGVPLIVLGGMYGGVFTPTEAGAIGSLVSLILAVVYRKLTPRSFYETVIDSAATTGMVLLLIAASYVVSYVMSFTGITQWFINFLTGLSGKSGYIGLLFLVVILLIMGCFIDLIVLCIILAPTAVAALAPLGINPYHINALFLIGNLIGIITPPVGVALFTSSFVLNEKIEKVSKELVPFILMYIIITIIIVLFPDSVLWLPRVLGFNV